MTNEWPHELCSLYELFSLCPTSTELAAIPSWTNPGPLQPSCRDGYSVACALLTNAANAAHEHNAALREDCYAGMARQILSCGKQVVDGPLRLQAYAGMPLFAGRVAAEAIRVACLEHVEAGRDGELLRLVDDCISSLWGRHGASVRVEKPQDHMTGMALRRHIEFLRYGQDVHRGLVMLARTAACDTALYSTHLRRLNQDAFDHHSRHDRHRSEGLPHLARALTALLPPAQQGDQDTDGGLQ